MSGHSFKANIWLYQGKAAWHFVTLPKAISQEIRVLSFDKKAAWGSVRVSVTIGSTSWKTSIFPDTKAGAYLLPIKSDVRKKEKITSGDTVKISITIAS
ncbi:MAG: DUF1905 domain-containing protein [Rickettsiales bacterium]|nr:DUF1905 domain-containing protein [Rickettsiales bacterium]